MFDENEMTTVDGDLICTSDEESEEEFDYLLGIICDILDHSDFRQSINPFDTGIICGYPEDDIKNALLLSLVLKSTAVKNYDNYIFEFEGKDIIQKLSRTLVPFPLTDAIINDKLKQFSINEQKLFSMIEKFNCPRKKIDSQRIPFHNTHRLLLLMERKVSKKRTTSPQEEIKKNKTVWLESLESLKQLILKTDLLK